MVDGPEEQRLHEERSAAGRQAAWDKDVVGGLLATPNGRYWVERLLEFCEMYDTVHTSIDDTLIKLGRRQVGAYMLDQIEQFAPDAYLRMIRERRARLEAARVKKVEDEKRLRRESTPPGVDDMPDETYLEQMMEQQARDYAPKEKPRA